MFLNYFLVCHLIALTFGNPFHKVPFVFLLDVGNEEIPKSKAEQIRISVPGGSIAMRYPAIGNGDIIAHVRVSGIDFGTNLKANIIEGGPGYTYVILMFVGNPGVEYDAVVSVQTITSDKTKKIGQSDNVQTIAMFSDNNDAINEIAEYPGKDEMQVDDGKNKKEISKNSEQQSQQSNLVYNYAKNGNTDDEQNEIEINDNTENDDQFSEDFDNDDDTVAEERENNQPVHKESEDSPKAEPYSINNGYVNDDSYDGEEPASLDSNLYEKYNALKSHLYGDVNAPQNAVDDAQDQEIKTDLGADEDPVEIDQIFNDEEVHNDAEKYKDLNNNYFDSDDSSAVAS